MSETPVETIRRAAALMRARAEAATPGPWEAQEGASGEWWVELRSTADVAIDLHGENARHIASWSPAPALRIADWLGRVAEDAADSLADVDEFESARDIARAYLGEAS